MPVIEIITGPEIDHPKDGELAIKELQELLQSLEVSDANMDLGQMRVDVKVSVKSNRFEGQRVEIKDVIGADNVEKSSEYEIIRQSNLLLAGEKVIKETRKYDA